MVDELPQAQVPGEGGWQEQAGIGHQAMVVKEDADTVGIVLWQHSIGCSLFPGGSQIQRSTLWIASRAVPKAASFGLSNTSARLTLRPKSPHDSLSL